MQMFGPIHRGPRGLFIAPVCLIMQTVFPWPKDIIRLRYIAAVWLQQPNNTYKPMRSFTHTPDCLAIPHYRPFKKQARKHSQENDTIWQ